MSKVKIEGCLKNTQPLSESLFACLSDPTTTLHTRVWSLASHSQASASMLLIFFPLACLAWLSALVSAFHSQVRRDSYT